MKNKIVHFTGAIALIITLASCAAVKPPKTLVPDELIEKVADHTWEVTDLSSWNSVASQIDKAGENKKHVVSVKNSFTVEPSFGFRDAFNIRTKNVVIVLEGDATISISGDESQFLVNEGQAIIVRDLKLQGNTNNTYSLVSVWDGGKFIMEGNASVQGNTSKSKSMNTGGGNCASTMWAGGVDVNKGTFIMRGKASVTGNIAGGKNCRGENFGKGGGVKINGGGTFIMQDEASVTGNIATEEGGGVDASGGTFIMQGNAIVSGNTANIGGGVYGSVTIQDNAKVSGNTARVADNDVHM